VNFDTDVVRLTREFSKELILFERTPRLEEPSTPGMASGLVRSFGTKNGFDFLVPDEQRLCRESK
jgi:hypothetical protein